MLAELKKEMRKLATAKRKETNEWFFKTGPGEYGEGDVFLGLTVPQQRKIAKKYKDLTKAELRSLVLSRFHEERLVGLFMLVDRYRKSKDSKDKEGWFEFYVKNMKGVNNWDLVDSSAHHIAGHHFYTKGINPPAKWVKSKNLWHRRIAVMSTFYHIQQNQFDEFLRIANQLVKDDEDLIHKAVGWMLRETGKRSLKTEEAFLKKHCKKMPRTMLRYAIEKFPEKKRKAYLAGRV